MSKNDFNVSPDENFEDFYRADIGRLIGFLVKLGAGRSDAEDAASEAMYALLDRWARVDAPRAWVRITAKRAWWRRQEQARREVAAGIDRWTQGAADRLANEDGEDTWGIRAALGCLPPTQREVFALHLDGFGTREISAITATTEATVRSNLRHSRIRLRQWIETEGEAYPRPIATRPAGEAARSSRRHPG